MIERVISLVVGYLFGLLQTGYFIGLIKHRDIRNYGSGNSGTTNAMRVLGKKAGSIVFIGDLLKAVLACLLIRWAAGRFGFTEEEIVLTLYTGFGVILGHNFPFYLNFKGGKGIASSWGLSLVLDWRIGLVSMIIFASTIVITKYVSLGSMVGTVVFAVVWFILIGAGWLEIPYGQTLEASIVLVVIVLLAIYRHKGNIQRLMNGTENRIGQKRKAEKCE